MTNDLDNLIKSMDYSTSFKSGSHWSLRVRKGTILRLTDVRGNANVGMLFYNPDNLLERYNAPDTLKCQHTFKITAGHCLYSDMGRIFASVVSDSFGWHDTVSGNSNADQVEAQWGVRDYQNDRNAWKQNGYDSFLVEMGKYGLGKADLAANLNWFSKVAVGPDGGLSLSNSGNAGDQVVLRFEMDTLVVLHTCPHPMDNSDVYPDFKVTVELGTAHPVKEDDLCLNACDENHRGFENNRLYHIGSGNMALGG